MMNSMKLHHVVLEHFDDLIAVREERLPSSAAGIRNSCPQACSRIAFQRSLSNDCPLICNCSAISVSIAHIFPFCSDERRFLFLVHDHLVGMAAVNDSAARSFFGSSAIIAVIVRSQSFRRTFIQIDFVVIQQPDDLVGHHGHHVVAQTRPASGRPMLVKLHGCRETT